MIRRAQMRGSALGKVSTKAGPEVQPRAPLSGAPCTEQRSSRAETSSSWRAPQERAQPHWVAFRCGSSRNATQVPPLISWHSQLEAMGSIGQRAGNGSEARPSLTSKLRDALGQALRSKQQGQQKNSRPAQGGINPSAAQGPRQGAVQPKGLETYTVALGDVAAAGGVAPEAAAAAVEGLTLSASTLEEVLHDLWGRGRDTAGEPAADHQGAGWGSAQATGPETGSREALSYDAPHEPGLLGGGQEGSQPGPAPPPWIQMQGRGGELGSGPEAGLGETFAPSALQAELRESVWYPIYGQCPSPTPAPPSLQHGALPPQPQPAPQLLQLPLPFLGAGSSVAEAWGGPGPASAEGVVGQGADEGGADFEVGLEQLDAAFGELQELLDSLQEGGEGTQPQASGAPPAQVGPSEAQWEAQGGHGVTEGTPGVSEGLDVDWSLGTPLDLPQALEGMRVWEGEGEQQGSTPGAPLTEFGAGAGAGASSGDMGGMLLDGERSHGSSQSRGAASAATLPQAEPSSLQAGGEVAAGQRRRRRDEDGKGGPSEEDPAGGRSIALRTGAGQAGAEAAASWGTAAAAGARLRLNELQVGASGAAGGVSGGYAGPVALLEAMAAAIAKGQEAEAQRLLGALHEVASQYGDAAQRVAAYCLQGFLAALPPLSFGAPPASQGSQGGGVAPSPSSSTSSASSSTSGSAASRPSSGKHRSTLLSLGWLDRALRTTRGGRNGALQAPGVSARVLEGEAMAPAEVDCEPQVMKSFQALMSATPLVTFGHVTANCALLEATAGAPKVHLVDVGTGHGLHLVPLIRAWAARPSGAPTVHLTLVDVASTELHRAYCVIQTSLRLKHAAEQFGLQGASLSMDVVYVKLEELEPQHVAPRLGYTCVVNCTMRLSQHLEGALAAPALAFPSSPGLPSGTPATSAEAVDVGSDAESSVALLPLGPEGQGPSGPRPQWSGVGREEQACRAVVRLIKALRPAVCTCVEYRIEPSPSSPTNPVGAGPSSPHMLSRFLEAVHHYVGVFESLDAAVGREHSHEQRVLEKEVLGRTIAASVACHGHWHRARLRTLNGQGKPLQKHAAGAGETQKQSEGSLQGGVPGEQGVGGTGAGARLGLGAPSSDVCHTMLLSERLRRGGLLRRAVSSAEVTTAQQLLGLYRDGFGLRLDGPNSLTLTWKGRALLSSSAWML